MIHRVSHGATEIRIGPAGVVTRLPSGRIVRARPNADSALMASALGYGDDVAALTADHDPLHAWLANACGLQASVALTATATPHGADSRLASLEEAAVLAVQAYCRAAGVRPWRCPS